MTRSELPLPPHFEPERVGQVWRVPYQERAAEAERWARAHGLRPAADDRPRVAVLIVDAQNTFCVPGFELYVGGRTGAGAVDDSRRLCEFLYRNLDALTHLVPTLDTHQAAQIFHALFLVDADGSHPAPYTLVSVEDVTAGRWRFNPALAPELGLSAADGERHLLHYARTLAQSGKYALTIWPYHAMLGGLGHALVSSVEEAIFFHSLARAARPSFQIKGSHPLTEHYSVFGPEVARDAEGRALAGRNDALVDLLLGFDAVIVAGQAKSHCVAWTVQDLLDSFSARDQALARKVYLLEDCTSPVVVPGAVDYTDAADAAFAQFAAAGMHLVRSTDPLARWPDFPA